MKKIASLSLLALSALALSSCCGGGCGDGQVYLKNSCTRNVHTGPVTAQGSTGERHIGLVPTMETLAE